MRDLSEIRDDIDGVDQRIVSLLKKRLLLSDEVAESKLRTGKAVYDKEREKAKLKSLSDLGDDPFTREGIGELFTQIMSISRKKQYKDLAEKGQVESFGFTPVDAFDFSEARILYQGVEGAYSEAALLTFFGPGHEIHHVHTWRDAFDRLKRGEADYAVLPIENSSAGAVTENYDLMTEYSASIIGEQIIKIEHALLALPGAKLSDIHTVYSHPQALMQCENYLRTSHPDFETRSVLNTAVAAKKVKEDGRLDEAAIAGRINADIYGLTVLDESIQDDRTNATRFLIVSERKVFKRDASTVSLSFELPDNLGSLYHILSNFIYNGLNLTRIESRPITGSPWEYRFFVDFEGNLLWPSVKNALKGLKEETSRMRILGNY